MSTLHRKGCFYSGYFLILTVFILSTGCAGWRHGSTTREYEGQMLSASIGRGAKRLEIEVNYNPVIRGFVQSRRTPDYIHVVSNYKTQLIYIEEDLLVTFIRGFSASKTQKTEEPIPNAMLALVSRSDQQRVFSARSRHYPKPSERTPTPSEPKATTVSDWRVKGNWSRIKTGMSFDQVIQILGRPTKTNMISPDLGTWYYEGYSTEVGAIVSGNIFFTDRQVLVVNPPIFW